MPRGIYKRSPKTRKLMSLAAKRRWARKRTRAKGAKIIQRLLLQRDAKPPANGQPDLEQLRNHGLAYLDHRIKVIGAEMRLLIDAKASFEKS